MDSTGQYKQDLSAEGMQLCNFHLKLISSVHHTNSEQFAVSHATGTKSRSCQSLPAVSAVLCVGGEVGWLSIQASGNISSRDSSLLRAVANIQFCWMESKRSALLASLSLPLSSEERKKGMGYHMRLGLRECNWFLPSRVERKPVTGITTIPGWCKGIIHSRSRTLVRTCFQVPRLVKRPGFYSLCFAEI